MYPNHRYTKSVYVSHRGFAVTLTAYIWKRVELGCNAWYCLIPSESEHHTSDAGGTYSTHDGGVEADQECDERQTAEKGEEFKTTKISNRRRSVAIAVHVDWLLCRYIPVQVEQVQGVVDLGRKAVKCLCTKGQRATKI